MMLSLSRTQLSRITVLASDEQAEPIASVVAIHVKRIVDDTASIVVRQLRSLALHQLSAVVCAKIEV